MDRSLPKRIVTTRPGLARLQQRLQDTRARYDAVCASNEDAAGAGDSSVWHDNFAYEDNQRQMHQLARRVRDLMHVLSVAELAHTPNPPRRVCLGCAVTVLDLEDDTEQRYVIGGWEDSDAALNRIAYNTPLASALIGAEEGDERPCPGARGPRTVEIIEITLAAPEEV